jgi:hypothetical protein
LCIEIEKKERDKMKVEEIKIVRTRIYRIKGLPGLTSIYQD